MGPTQIVHLEVECLARKLLLKVSPATEPGTSGAHRKRLHVRLEASSDARGMRYGAPMEHGKVHRGDGDT